MHKTKLVRVWEGKFLPTIAAMIGAAGFVSSLLLAWLMSQWQGNPAVLIVWIVAAAAMASAARFNRRWNNALERMYAMNVPRAAYPSRRTWNLDVEDVAFRELPNSRTGSAK